MPTPGSFRKGGSDLVLVKLPGGTQPKKAERRERDGMADACHSCPEAFAHAVDQCLICLLQVLLSANREDPSLRSTHQDWEK